MDQALLERIDRIEAHQAIQQLAVKYAMAVDARDVDAWLGMFVNDIDCGRRGKVREALRTFIEPAVRDFYPRSIPLPATPSTRSAATTLAGGSIAGPSMSSATCGSS